MANGGGCRVGEAQLKAAAELLRREAFVLRAKRVQPT
jgi:hypothetical protein